MSVTGTTSPASATSVGSSKVTATRSIVRDDELTESASWLGITATSSTAIFPSREALSADTRASDQAFNRWIEAKGTGESH